MSNRSVNIIQSIDRAMNILELILKNEPIGVTDLSEITKIHKSTVYRILNTLVQLGYVSQNNDGKYHTGLKLFEIGSKAINGLDLRQTASPYLKELQKKTGETIHLGVLDDTDIIYIDKVESDKTIRMHSNIGKRSYVHSTSLGKVILAYSSKNIIEKIITEKGLPKMAINTITNPDEFRKRLKLVNYQGFALDEEENEIGIRCIAGPIFNYRGEITAAFSISGPSIRVTKEKIMEYKDLVKFYSKKISIALGCNCEERCADG